MKHRLCCALVLTLPNLQQPFEIETDASDYAIGEILTQQGHPVAYHSKRLSDTIRKYPTYDKDMYSILLNFKAYSICIFLWSPMVLPGEPLVLLCTLMLLIRRTNKIHEVVPSNCKGGSLAPHCGT